MSIDLSKIIIIIIFSAIEPFTQINRQNAKDFLSLLLHFHNNSEYLPPLESDFQKKIKRDTVENYKRFVHSAEIITMIYKGNSLQCHFFSYLTKHFFGSDTTIVFYPRQFLFCYMEEVCISSLFEYFFSKMQKKSSTASPYYKYGLFLKTK